MTRITHFVVRYSNGGRSISSRDGYSAFICNAGTTELYLTRSKSLSEQEALPIPAGSTVELRVASIEGFWILGDEIDGPIPKTKWIYDDE